MNILMVCLGNICRSPLAEGILRSKSRHLNWHIDSAGTAAYHVGERPDPRSIAIAKDYDIDITSLRGRQFIVEDFDDFDLIYAMDTENYKNIIVLARHENDKQKVKMILNEIHPENNHSVPDPYFGGDDGFYSVYKMLDEACNSIIKKYHHD